MGMTSRTVVAVMVFVIFIIQDPTTASRLDDDSMDFLTEYFATRPITTDRICVGRMKSCLPWENECCEDLRCANYGGGKCDYDTQMCVCLPKGTIVR